MAVLFSQFYKDEYVNDHIEVFVDTFVPFVIFGAHNTGKTSTVSRAYNRFKHYRRTPFRAHRYDFSKRTYTADEIPYDCMDTIDIYLLTGDMEQLPLLERVAKDLARRIGGHTVRFEPDPDAEILGREDVLLIKPSPLVLEQLPSNVDASELIDPITLSTPTKGDVYGFLVEPDGSWRVVASLHHMQIMVDSGFRGSTHMRFFAPCRNSLVDAMSIVWARV